MPQAVSDSADLEADRDWFSRELEALLPELYGTALRLCGERMDAEDMVADSVAKAWGALPSLAERTSFRGWLFRILHNTFITHCRKQRARPVHESVEDDGEASFSLFERLHAPILLWWGNPELEFLNRLLRADLARAIDELPDAFRVVVVMVDVQGLSYRAAADVLDIPLGTVRSRLARGRAQLQEKLWQHAVDAGWTDGTHRQPGES